ncbi:MAG: YraN family protein [Synechococcaceae cyanobacterium RM1_1_27]|nr:YraN family protein [Synechococcaceae cyanobacterium SM2_3_2]NJO85717.1 YraN family protein [Synechococcaceae cyanobacterium RM1_1_27]
MDPSPGRTSRQRIGDSGEELVAHHLLSQHWQIVAQQWRCRWGELDVVAHKGSTLAFVEVKTRAVADGIPLHLAQQFRDPSGLGAIGSRKREKIIKTAQAFLATHPGWTEWHCRFDIALVQHRDPALGATSSSGIPGWSLYRYIPAAFEVEF